ncbi:hypothetical protein QJS10_CPA05g00040 [Acorus calamus]|uniref:glutamate--tRNA ligase n=1 Tax=Acorus calamus TaxID=4465 RepID=A0AAV9EW69_ACOCL|nr:hypothetical protein QJS10_CPA05g00040 [Acorus calamus]
MEAAKLVFPADAPPLSVICAARIAAVSLDVDPSLPSGSPPVLRFSSGKELRGTTTLLRYIGHAASRPGFYLRDAFETGQIDEWIEDAAKFSSGSEFEDACLNVDGFLSLRTFLVGYSLSIADVAIWSGLAGSGQRWESLIKSLRYPNLIRWYNSIAAEYSVPLNEVTSAYVGKRGLGKPLAKPKGTSERQMTNGTVGKERAVSSFEVDLPGAKIGEVSLRFAPEPSGYLHIGHAKAALLNQYFAQRYKGRLIVRFDDTNPSKESSEFVENLMKDIDTLGVKYEAVTYTSDYFDQLMKMVEDLITKGKAYVDDTPREQMQKERMDGIESRCRNNTLEQNMVLWKEMVQGSERGLECCVRGKLDMQAPNKSLRDPVYYRCNLVSHHRIGSSTRNDQYYRILDDMGLRKVQIYEFSRLNLVYTLLSKRKLLWFVQNGRVEGWDDARFPTVQGIVRRGLKIDALIQFILEQGASKNLNLMEWDKLWTINKKIIDPICPRHTAVLEDRRVLLDLADGPKEPLHKKYDGAGTKATTYTKKIWIEYADASSVSIDEEITLMDWGNAIIRGIEKDQDGNVTHMTGTLHLKGSVKTTKLKLTWLPETDELVHLSLVEFDYLITKKKLDEGEDFLDVLNPCTRWETTAFGDSNMRNLKRGEILQLERKGYFRCDPAKGLLGPDNISDLKAMWLNHCEGWEACSPLE